MHGKGTRRWTNGDVYEGEFRDGKAAGNGKFTYANGDVYDGEFDSDLANGYGNFISQEDGSKKSG